MTKAQARPVSDPGRLEAIARTGLAGQPDQVLDRFAALTRRLLRVPIALVSLVDDEHEFFPGQMGLPRGIRAIPLGRSFCQHVVESGEPMVIPDAREDERLCANPEIDDLGIIAYLGAPLCDDQGHVLGALCAIDRRPRGWTGDERQALGDLAVAVSSELQLRLTVSSLTTERITSDAGRLLAESAEIRAVDARQDAAHARERAESAVGQLALLAEVGRSLNSTLNPEEAAARLSRLVLPDLADWCLVVLADEDGNHRDVGWAHRDPAAAEDVELLARRHSVHEGSVMARVIETGQLESISAIEPIHADVALPDPDARAAFDRLAAESVTVLPLQARGSTFGAIGLFAGAGRGPLAGAQLETAVEVTRRASLAIDNARLFGRQLRVAETLQRTMLSDPPTPPRTDVVARYRAATVDAQIGGDWHDAFLLPDGSMVLVVGDVIGHDLTAAAAMGQMRSLVRGIAYDRGESPAELLTRVDRAIGGLGLDTLATAVIVRVESAPPAGGGRLMRWSSAGHPPPVVIGADGSAHTILDEADLLLGMRPGVRRRNHELTLEAGGTLLLYTDGLIERRGGSLEDGLTGLTSGLHELCGLPLAGLCDALLHRLLPQDHDDDVVLVAVRNLP